MLLACQVDHVHQVLQREIGDGGQSRVAKRVGGRELGVDGLEHALFVACDTDRWHCPGGI